MRKDTISSLIDLLGGVALANADVIPWSSPVPAFGDPTLSRVATLGLNPSNREFVGADGEELDGPLRRFHTLKSFKLRRWTDVEDKHLDLIADSCRTYFTKNPYDAWFKRLDNVISATHCSFYGGITRQACHLDLIPYATATKWSSLKSGQRTALLRIAGETVGELLRGSSIRVLILNGSSVVTHFQGTSRISLEETVMPEEWTLPRSGALGVRGIAYKGLMEEFSGLPLGHQVLVLGYNHNLQSSFGVTREVMLAIRQWIGTTVRAEGFV